jgi:hypothetical protein
MLRVAVRQNLTAAGMWSLWRPSPSVNARAGRHKPAERAPTVEHHPRDLRQRSVGAAGGPAVQPAGRPVRPALWVAEKPRLSRSGAPPPPSFLLSACVPSPLARLRRLAQSGSGPLGVLSAPGLRRVHSSRLPLWLLPSVLDVVFPGTPHLVGRLPHSFASVLAPRPHRACSPWRECLHRPKPPRCARRAGEAPWSFAGRLLYRPTARRSPSAPNECRESG